MDPTYAPAAVRYNQFSPKLKEHLKEWEARKGITPDELLEFEFISHTGDAPTVAYKSTFDADSMYDAQKGKPVGEMSLLNGESIIDPGTDDFINLTYFEGGWAPGKVKGRVWFKGKEKAVLHVRKNSNLALYLHLAFSNYTEDNANPSRSMPAGGYLYRLIRPTEVVEEGWKERMEKSEAIQAIGVSLRSTLLHIAPSLKGVSHPEGITDDQLRENIARFAEQGQNYKLVTQLLNADETKFTQHVEKAIEASVVYVDTENALWRFSTSQDAICPASPTDSTPKQLVKFLLAQDGQTTYKQILALTEKAKKGK